MMNRNHTQGFSLLKASLTPLSRVIPLSLSACLLTGMLAMPCQAQVVSPSNVLTGDVRVTVNPANLRQSLPILGADRKVTMSFRGVDLQDALRALAKEGNFNVLIDESVTGTLNLDLNKISIQDALETIKTASNLSYSIQGRSLLVADAASVKGQSFNQSTTRIFPLRYTNAKVMANFMNSTIFGDRAAGSSGKSSGGSGSTGSNTALTVTPDFHTNSLIVVGTPTDMKTVQQHIESLDQPRQTKTWRLSQANVLDVATIISSSIFNEGQPALSTGASASSSGNSGAGGSPSSLRVTAETMQDGSGAAQASNSSSSGGGQTSLVNSLTLRSRIQQTQTVQVSPNGPILLPDTRLNTLTLMGTAEQIAMVEAMIPILDRKVPQVVLEASLIEISEDGRKELGFSSGSNLGVFSSGSNTGGSTLINRAFSNSIGSSTSATTPLETLYRFTSRPATRRGNIVYQLNALVSKSKAKMLANPTVITTSDNETMISITDEIIRSITVTQGTNGAPPTFSTNIGEAGIVLNILPKIGANNTISMRVRPVVSTIARTERDRFGNLVTLLSKREALAQNVQLQDGETFVLGGLIHNTNRESVTQDPILSRLPIVGALARNSNNAKHRSELVILITPHIMNDESAVARSNSQIPTSQMLPGSMSPAAAEEDMQNGEKNFHPVSLRGPGKRNAIPPLEPAHRLEQNSSLPTDIQQKSSANHVDANQIVTVQSTIPVQEAAKTTVAPIPPVEVTEDALRAIINRFNKP